jgi:ABC-type transport system involved in cytochrome bd biosynthesis fused ATPase/permease subunit
MAIFFYNEQFQFFHLIGAILIILGLFLSNKEIKMLNVAILDDYQNVSQQFIDLEKLSGKYEIKISVNLLLMKQM